jgi:hypothetical protein
MKGPIKTFPKCPEGVDSAYRPGNLITGPLDVKLIDSNLDLQKPGLVDI